MSFNVTSLFFTEGKGRDGPDKRKKAALMKVKTEKYDQMSGPENEMEIEKELQLVELEKAKKEKEELLKSEGKLDETQRSYERQKLNLEKLQEPLESLILD